MHRPTMIPHSPPHTHPLVRYKASTSIYDGGGCIPSRLRTNGFNYDHQKSVVDHYNLSLLLIHQ
jgi:hypothetical protein